MTDTQYILPDKTRLVAGVDEVARGTFIGPVIAACVVLPSEFPDDNYKQIKNELNRVLNSKEIRFCVSNYEIDLYKNYIFYLIKNISYYLEKYILQKDLHEQVFWLLEVWEEAVIDVINTRFNFVK